mgnify:CR=1 FL=1|tara:strand:+ start:197 stop:2110 length:1914 start_codon:yes stop_codon:yes gene_type:complete
MAVEKTINIRLDAADAITDLKKVRGEIDITYAELRRTTPIELDGSQAKTVLKDVSQEIKSTAKDVKTIGQGAKESTKGFEALQEGAKKTGDSVLDAIPGFKAITTATKSWSAALKATGIGLIIGSIVALQSALSKNQVVMDAFNVITETISITVQEFVNKVVKATQTAVNFFSKVGKFIKKFTTQDIDGLTTSYEANAGAVETTIQKNKRLAKELVSLRKEVKLAEAEQRLLQLTYQKEAEIQRQIRDDVSLTMEERIAANTKLGEILNKQFEEERAISEKKLELAEIELSKNKDNVDLQVAVINAKTELADLDERITGQRSEQLINLTGLQNEQTEAIKATVEAERQAAAEVAKYQQDRDNKKQSSADAFQELLDRNLTNAQVAEKKIREEFKKMNDVIVQGIVTGSITAEQAVTQTSLLGQEKRQALSDSAQAHTQADIDFLMFTMGKSKAFIEQHTAEELELIAHKNRVDLDEAQKTAQMKDAKLQAGLSAAKGVTDALGGLAKEGSKGAKAMALTGILIDTAKGISGAIAAGAGVPFPGNLLAIATGVTSVLSGIANAKAVFAKAGGDSGSIDGASAGTSVRGSRDNIPNIENIADSQLGQETPAAPLQAYVVENDISDSQALQEELETQATL